MRLLNIRLCEYMGGVVYMSRRIYDPNRNESPARS